MDKAAAETRTTCVDCLDWAYLEVIRKRCAGIGHCTNMSMILAGCNLLINVLCCNLCVLRSCETAVITRCATASSTREVNEPSRQSRQVTLPNTASQGSCLPVMAIIGVCIAELLFLTETAICCKLCRLLLGKQAVTARASSLLHT